MKLGAAPMAPTRTAQLPIQTGVVLTGPDRDQLKPFGYKDGDPLPGNLAAMLAAGRAELDQDAAAPPLPIAPDTPPTRPKTVRDLTELSTEHQAELIAALQQARDKQAAYQAAGGQQPTFVPGADPSVNAALAAAARPSEPPLLKDQPEEPAAAPGTGAMTASRLCARCGWDQAKPRDVEITEEDKLAYLASVQGGQRFCKTYTMLGGRLRAIFRDLTPHEWVAGRQQVIADAQTDLRTNSIRELIDYELDANTYIMVMGLKRLEGVGDEPFDILPLAEFAVEQRPGESRLKAMCRVVIDKAMPTNAIQLHLASAYGNFRTLLDQLTSRGLDPNFWGATGGPV